MIQNVPEQIELHWFHFSYWTYFISFMIMYRKLGVDFCLIWYQALHYSQQEITANIIEPLLCGRHSFKHFAYINLFT